jgi:hypothetical protein
MNRLLFTAGTTIRIASYEPLISDIGKIPQACLAETLVDGRRWKVDANARGWRGSGFGM